MIPASVQVFVALEPVDMRYGLDRLSAMVRERMRYEPRSGALFVLVGRRRQLVKIWFGWVRTSVARAPRCPCKAACFRDCTRARAHLSSVIFRRRLLTGGIRRKSMSPSDS